MLADPGARAWIRHPSSVTIALSYETPAGNSVTGRPAESTGAKDRSCEESPTRRFSTRPPNTSWTGRQRTRNGVTSAPSEARSVASPACVHLRTPLSDTGTARPDVHWKRTPVSGSACPAASNTCIGIRTATTLFTTTVSAIPATRRAGGALQAANAKSTTAETRLKRRTAADDGQDACAASRPSSGPTCVQTLDSPATRRLLRAPQSAAQDPAADSHPLPTWSADVSRLRDLVQRFAARGAAAAWPASRVFGRMSGPSWGVMLHKHLDHHLRQFGV